jgi:glycosyltransferase involved in cell wall biosynthesis
MIYFDATKTGARAPRSGLTRVSRRLRAELAAAATEIAWHEKSGAFRPPLRPAPHDWFLTSELFAPAERPGFAEFLEHRPCRLAAIYHDAIPLKHPHTTWPQSVARHPAYLKMLSRFDRIWAVSETSRTELIEFWQWIGVTSPPPVDVLTLGADFQAQPRITHPGPILRSRPRILCLGIIEPRKNQLFLLDVCDELWAGGLDFELHLVGRVNPHFGGPILSRLKTLRRQHGSKLQHHESTTDTALTKLYANTQVTALPTIAEGCGLPLLESLWMGVPVICSDIAAIQENAREGGCVVVPVSNHAAWKAALHRILTDETARHALVAAAQSRPLPTWSAAAETLRRALG